MIILGCWCAQRVCNVLFARAGSGCAYSAIGGVCASMGEKCGSGKGSEVVCVRL